jgi:hypothetical protein
MINDKITLTLWSFFLFIVTYLIKMLNSILKAAQQWWRPLCGLAIFGCLVANGIYIPIFTGHPVNLLELSALVTAVAGTFAVREWGKINGND